MIIEYLADHKEFIPTLARWCYEEWSYLHPERTLSEVERLISERTNRDCIPACLVAIDKGKPVGMAELKTSDFKARPELSPWLSGMYVDESQRRNGIGTELVHAIEKLAARLGTNNLYLVTDDAERFYEKLGWVVRDRTVWRDLSVTVMQKDISGFR